MKKNIIFIFTTILLTLNIVSCKNLLSGNDVIKEETVTLRGMIATESNKGHTALPLITGNELNENDIKITVYSAKYDQDNTVLYESDEVTLQKEEKFNSIDNKKLFEIYEVEGDTSKKEFTVNITTGKRWLIEVSVGTYNESTGVFSNIKFSGFSDWINLESSSLYSNQGNVTVKPIQNGTINDGSIKLKIKNSSSKNLYLKVNKTDTNNNYEYPDVLSANGGTKTVENTNIKSSSIEFVFNFYTDSQFKELVYSCNEKINVYDNLETNTWVNHGNAEYFTETEDGTEFVITDQCLENFELRNIWVDATSGNDANSGSWVKPLKTLEKAIAKVENSTKEGPFTIHLMDDAGGSGLGVSSVTLTKSLTICGEKDGGGQISIKNNSSSGTVSNSMFCLKNTLTTPIDIVFKNLKISGEGKEFSETTGGSPACCISNATDSKELNIVLDNVTIIEFKKVINENSGTAIYPAGIQLKSNSDNINLTIKNGTNITECIVEDKENDDFNGKTILGTAIYIYGAKTTCIIDDAIFNNNKIQKNNTITSIDANDYPLCLGTAIHNSTNAKCIIKKALFYENGIHDSEQLKLKTYGGVIYNSGSLTLGDDVTTVENGKANYPDVIIGKGYYNGINYKNESGNFISNSYSVQGGAVYCGKINNETTSIAYTMKCDACIGCFEEITSNTDLQTAQFANFITGSTTNGVKGAGLYISSDINSYNITGGCINNNCVDSNLVYGIGIYIDNTTINTNNNPFKNLTIAYNRYNSKNGTDKCYGIGLYVNDMPLVFDNITIKDNYGKASYANAKIYGSGACVKATSTNNIAILKKVLFERNYSSNNNRLSNDIYFDYPYNNAGIKLSTDFEPATDSGTIANIQYGYTDTTGVQIISNQNINYPNVKDYYERFGFFDSEESASYTIDENGKLINCYYFAIPGNVLIPSTYTSAESGTRRNPWTTLDEMNIISSDNAEVYLDGSFTYNGTITLQNSLTIKKLDGATTAKIESSAFNISGDDKTIEFENIEFNKCKFNISFDSEHPDYSSEVKFIDCKIENYEAASTDFVISLKGKNRLSLLGKTEISGCSKIVNTTSQTKKRGLITVEGSGENKPTFIMDGESCIDNLKVEHTKQSSNSVLGLAISADNANIVLKGSSTIKNCTYIEEENASTICKGYGIYLCSSTLTMCDSSKIEAPCDIFIDKPENVTDDPWNIIKINNLNLLDKSIRANITLNSFENKVFNYYSTNELFTNIDSVTPKTPDGEGFNDYFKISDNEDGEYLITEENKLSKIVYFTASYDSNYPFYDESKPQSSNTGNKKDPYVSGDSVNSIRITLDNLSTSFLVNNSLLYINGEISMSNDVTFSKNLIIKMCPGSSVATIKSASADQSKNIKVNTSNIKIQMENITFDKCIFSEGTSNNASGINIKLIDCQIKNYSTTGPNSSLIKVNGNNTFSLSGTTISGCTKTISTSNSNNIVGFISLTGDGTNNPTFIMDGNSSIGGDTSDDQLVIVNNSSKEIQGIAINANNANIILKGSSKIKNCIRDGSGNGKCKGYGIYLKSSTLTMCDSAKIVYTDESPCDIYIDSPASSKPWSKIETNNLVLDNSIRAKITMDADTNTVYEHYAESALFENKDSGTDKTPNGDGYKKYFNVTDKYNNEYMIMDDNTILKVLYFAGTNCNQLPSDNTEFGGSISKPYKDLSELNNYNASLLVYLDGEFNCPGAINVNKKLTIKKCPKIDAAKEDPEAIIYTEASSSNSILFNLNGGSNKKLYLDGITIDGYYNTSKYGMTAFNYSNTNSEVELNNCNIQNSKNETIGNKGIVHVDQSGGKFTMKGESKIINCQYKVENSSVDYGDHAIVKIFNNSTGFTFTMEDNAEIADCEVSNNGHNVVGGAIYLNYGEVILKDNSCISGCKIDGNGYGAGIFVRNGTVTLQDEAIIKDCKIIKKNNKAVGAGIFGGKHDADFFSSDGNGTINIKNKAQVTGCTIGESEEEGIYLSNYFYSLNFDSYENWTNPPFVYVATSRNPLINVSNLIVGTSVSKIKLKISSISSYQTDPLISGTCPAGCSYSDLFTLFEDNSHTITAEGKIE